MTQGREPGREDDWGAPTDWQAAPPPPATGQPSGGYQAPPPQQFPPPPQWQGWQGGPPQGGWPGGPPVAPQQTWMVPAVLVTLFCFLPTGIAAIVYASQVTSKQQVGDYAGASAAADKAKMWVIISAVLGVILGILIVSSISTSGGLYYY
jgi:hypothetical protein